MIDDQFLKVVDGYRRGATRRGDTLQAVALRELGDAARWSELAMLNGLLPPYITDDPGAAGPRVLLSGESIMVPAPPSNTDPEALYFSDLDLTGGRLIVGDGGDLAVLSGMDNLVQALRHRILVQKRELIFHPKYGCYAQRMLGGKVTAQTAALVAFYVRGCLLEDPRVSSVIECTATARGDVIAVVAKVAPVSSAPVNIELLM